MLSSRSRPWKIALLLALALVLCAYSAVRGPVHTNAFHTFAVDPERYDGSPLNFSIEKVLGVEGQDVFLRSGPTVARLRVPGGPPRGIERGTWVSARGIFRAGGPGAAWVDVQGGIYVHKLRVLKEVASAGGLLGLLACFFFSYRWNRAASVFEERGRCRI